jgi:hypothetical protein
MYEEMCMQAFMMDGQTDRTKSEEGRKSNIKKSNISVFRIIEMSFKNQLSSKQNRWTKS